MRPGKNHKTILSCGLMDHLELGSKYYQPPSSTACLAYLSGLSIADSVTYDTRQSPLVGYATTNWCHHLLQSQPGLKLQEKLKFFQSSATRRHIWQNQWLLMGIAGYFLPRLLRCQHGIQTCIKEANLSSNIIL